MRDVRPEVKWRWPLGGALEESSRARLVGLALAFVGLGLLAALVPIALTERLVLGCLAVGGVARLGAVFKARRRRRPHGSVTVEGRALVRREDGKPQTTLADLSAPFGIAILANPMRTEALLAFTTPSHTRFQRVRVTSPQDAAGAREMLGRAITVPDADAVGSQSIESSLTATHAAELVRVAERHAPNALQRLYLTGSRGEVLMLDGAELTVDTRVFDLSLPLEWRGFMFHESVGPIATMYQGTWIRQGGMEVVLVAPMPAEVTTTLPPGAAADMRASEQRAVLRDLRLMQSAADAPPPRELRVGVERIFMLPLRQALDAAPRASRADIPPVRDLNPSAS